MPYCSWCLKDVQATVAQKAVITRNLLRCPACHHTLVKCRACANYACWESFTITTPEGGAKRIDQHDQFCAEHRHDVRNFQRLNDRLKSPDTYRTIYDFRVPNLAKGSKMTLVTLGGVAVGGPLAWVAAPAIGGALGSAMGLSGAAATSAGLAAIGGGAIAAGKLGMAGGLAIITAVGGGVGGLLSAYVAGHYLGDVEEFEIYKVRDGRKPALITVNGFLSQRGEAHERWTPGIASRFPDREWFHVQWEAKRLASLGALCTAGGTCEGLRMVLKKAAKRAAKQAKKRLNASATAAQMLALCTNPWHVAFVNAEKAGVLLADILSRCDRRNFILIGHSLGSRVIYACMQALATTNKRRIDGCYLLGGAVHNGSSDWQAAARALRARGQIHNYWSSNDLVLKYLYSLGTFLQSEPIGRRPILSVDQISNYNLSHQAVGHMDYKSRLSEILLSTSGE